MRSSIPMALALAMALTITCSSLAWPSSRRQEAAQPNPTPGQNSTVPSQSSATPQSPPAAGNPQGAATPSGQKAAPLPKPPVLQHKKRKAGAHSSSAHKKKPTGGSTDDPSKVVVRNGGATEGSAQLTPAVSPGQAKTQRAYTASLLAETDANLKRIAGRQLTPDQQSTMDQIRTYMQQSKDAATAADTDRAQTLAYKARLLSEELLPK
jgi:hypothetical protein